MVVATLRHDHSSAGPSRVRRPHDFKRHGGDLYTVESFSRLVWWRGEYWRWEKAPLHSRRMTTMTPFQSVASASKCKGPLCTSHERIDRIATRGSQAAGKEISWRGRYLQIDDEQRRQPGRRRHQVGRHDRQLHVLTDVVDLARDAEHVRAQQHAHGVSGRLLHAVAQVVARSHLRRGESPLRVFFHEPNYALEGCKKPVSGASYAA